MTSPNLIPDKLQPLLAPCVRTLLSDIRAISETPLNTSDFVGHAKKIQASHLKTVRQVVSTVSAFSSQAGPAIERDTQKFLDMFLKVTFSSHIVIEECLSLETGRNMIAEESPVQVAVNAANKAQAFSQAQFNHPGPNIQILDFSSDRPTLYIESYLEHMIFQLLKNAIQASERVHTKTKMPDIRVVVAEGDEDVSF